MSFGILPNPSINFNVRSAFHLSEADTKSKNFVNISSSRFFEASILSRNLSVDSFKTSAFPCLDFFWGFLTFEMFLLIFCLFLTFSFAIELSGKGGVNVLSFTPTLISEYSSSLERLTYCSEVCWIFPRA